MSFLLIQTIFIWLLVIFFVVGGCINMAAPKPIAAQYATWGFPNWFHFVTGGLELATAILLTMSLTRIAGAVLGSAIMLAAATTVTLNRMYRHAILPATVAILTAVSGWVQ
jgi:hypothetical protein